jgi:patatin-like phospholipase/acyl hydrolase
LKIILSIDGGGVRGLVPLTILSYLEEKIKSLSGEFQIPLVSLFDFVGASSTGSILASLMLIPSDNNTKYPKYKISEITPHYIRTCEEIFKIDKWRNLKTLWGLFGTSFSHENLGVPLAKEFKNYKMEDLIKPCLFCGYDIEERRLHFYTNHDEDKKFSHLYLRDVLNGTISTAHIFSPVAIKDGIHIEVITSGSLFINNPAMCSYIEISKTLFGDDKSAHIYGPKDILLLSLGTGRVENGFKKIKKWKPKDFIMNSMSSNADMIHYILQKIFLTYKCEHNYKRINPTIRNLHMFDSSKENITNIIKDTNTYIKENKEMLNVIAREIWDLNFGFR